MKISAATLARFASLSAWASTLPICVDPPRTSMRLMRSLSPCPPETKFEARHSLKTAEIDELDVEAAERRRGFEHFRLKRLGEIPGRLPAHGGVEGEDQPAAAGRPARGNLFRRLDEGGDVLSPVTPCERAVLVLVHRRTPVSVCLALKLGALTRLTSRPRGKRRRINDWAHFRAATSAIIGRSSSSAREGRAATSSGVGLHSTTRRTERPASISAFSVVPKVRCCFRTPFASQSVTRAPSIA